MTRNSPNPNLVRHGGTSARVLVYATQAGGVTLDDSQGGGNPFATALIELAGSDDTTLRSLPVRLRMRTSELSQRIQEPEFIATGADSDWRWTLRPGSREERRVALVLVVSDYSSGKLDRSLDGAALDERRVAAMLAQSGFSVTQGIWPDRVALISALRSFERTAREADVAVVYSTGHGFQPSDDAFLVPGDYPVALDFDDANLALHGVSVEAITNACAARNVNITFFAGCRTGP